MAGRLWKEHLRAGRVSNTKKLTASTTLYNANCHRFPCEQLCTRGQNLHHGHSRLCSLSPGLFTLLLELTFCPDGLISSGLVPRGNQQVRGPHLQTRAPRLRRRSLNEARPRLSWGGCRAGCQQCVFTFMYFHKSSSCPLELLELHLFQKGNMLKVKNSCSGSSVTN